ncbi:hypothetical protein CHS0354_006638 [Potamilus streckersoni]|uniref:Uncharacterized protein n=1 Tax=Potamilus streckersoni TaxID=2493646 RepID=A0AAE0SXA5_9BIVA|nr:hypothetical protein CHS0354_006638 [Potamilus streckersoni]
MAQSWHISSVCYDIHHGKVMAYIMTLLWQISLLSNIYIIGIVVTYIMATSWHISRVCCDIYHGKLLANVMGKPVRTRDTKLYCLHFTMKILFSFAKTTKNPNWPTNGQLTK